jgi:hypothetical protein
MVGATVCDAARQNFWVGYFQPFSISLMIAIFEGLSDWD